MSQALGFRHRFFRLRPAKTCSSASSKDASTSSSAAANAVEHVSALYQGGPRYLLNRVPSHQETLYLTEVAVLSGLSKEAVAKLVESVPRITFRSTTSYTLRLNIARWAAFSKQSPEQVISALETIPGVIMNYRMPAQTWSLIAELMFSTGKSAAEIIRVIETVPEATFRRATSYEMRLWLSKLSVISGETRHRNRSSRLPSSGSLFRRTTKVSESV